MGRPQGIDVSHHHPVTDWVKLGEQGLEIFGAKATNGLGLDRTFEAHRTGARALVTFDLVLYYHFPTPRSSAVAQADHFVEQVMGGLRPNERLVLDVEYDKANDWCPDIRFVDEFTAELMRLVPDRRFFVYTSARIWGQYLKGAQWSKAIACDLWAPRYQSGEEWPLLPRDSGGFPIWPSVKVWQDSDSFICPGVKGPCDHNVFNGTKDDLTEYMKKGPPPK